MKEDCASEAVSTTGFPSRALPIYSSPNVTASVGETGSLTRHLFPILINYSPMLQERANISLFDVGQ